MIPRPTLTDLLVGSSHDCFGARERKGTERPVSRSPHCCTVIKGEEWDPLSFLRSRSFRVCDASLCAVAATTPCSGTALVVRGYLFRASFGGIRELYFILCVCVCVRACVFFLILAHRAVASNDERSLIPLGGGGGEGLLESGANRELKGNPKEEKAESGTLVVARVEEVHS